MYKSFLGKSVVVGLVLVGIVFPITTVPVNAASAKTDGEKFCREKSIVHVVKTIKMIVTAYSSSPDETDDTPDYTASGKHVEDGVIANNLLPFGTRVRIPALYGDKVFIVEDRMHERKGYYMADVWKESKQAAREAGAKLAIVEVIES